VGAGRFVRILKEEGRLEVWAEATPRWERRHHWPLLAWSGTLGPKRAEGDEQAPEGWYRLDATSLRPDSRYRRALDLGFPNERDRALGRTGSFLMIHGGDRSVGCYAIGDGPIEELFGIVAAAVEGGASVPVLALPFEATPERLAAAVADGGPWADEWRDLAAVDAAFRTAGRPPVVEVRDGRYVVVSQSTR
jgi:murein L,D-transpeptidase YafK